MDSKKINYLAVQSYENDVLDVKKVNSIVKFLNRSDLKKYINALKRIEREKTLIVVSPYDNKEKNVFESSFPNKKIVFKKDPSLMAGVKIINNDIVYELNLKNTLNDVVEHIKQSYD